MKTQGIISILVGIISFITFTLLLISKYITGVIYLSLLSLLCFFCLVIPVIGRLKELDLKNLKLTLEKIEQTKKEIYAKEQELKEISLILSELIAAHSTLTSIRGDEESEKLRKELINEKIKMLAKKLKFTNAQVDSIFKYERALKKISEAPCEELKKTWTEFKNFLRDEIKNTKNSLTNGCT